MAMAKKCDRCGRLYEHSDKAYDGMDINGISLVENGATYGSHTTKLYIDLCPECLTKLIEWFEGGEDVEHENDSEQVAKLQKELIDLREAFELACKELNEHAQDIRCTCEPISYMGVEAIEEFFIREAERRKGDKEGDEE